MRIVAGTRRGALWFVEGQVIDGSGQPAGRRVFCLYHDARHGEISQVPPAILWDLEPLSSFYPTNGSGSAEERRSGGASPSPAEGLGSAGEGWGGGSSSFPADLYSLLSDEEAIQDYLIADVLLPFRAEIATRRERVAVDRHPFVVSGMWSGNFGSRAESPDDDRWVSGYVGVSGVRIPSGGAVEPQWKGEAPDPGGAGLRAGNFGKPFDQWQRGDPQPPWTNGRLVPANGVSAPGFHSTTSSIFRAMARSKSVTPPALCVLRLTTTLPQVTIRSGW